MTDERHRAAHMAHCYQGDYEGGCKYGGDNCPAASSDDAIPAEAVAAAIKATEYKYFGDYEMSNDQREAVDVLVDVARKYYTPAASSNERDGARGRLECLFDQAFTDGIAAGKSGDESILAGSSAAYAQSALLALAASGSGDAGSGWDYRPQCSDPKFGPEPSIRQMVRFYYGKHGQIDPDGDTEAYLSSLAASRPADAGAGEPFAYFQYNSGWDVWEQVADEHKDDHEGIVAAYRHPLATPKPPVDEPWPGYTADQDKRRVETLAKLGMMLSVMSGGEAPEVTGFDAGDLYADVLMALGIEDAEDEDIALQVARDEPEGHMLTDAPKPPVDANTIERQDAQEAMGLIADAKTLDEAQAIAIAFLTGDGAGA